MVYISRLETESGTWEVTASDCGVTGVCLQTSFVQAPENRYSRQAAEELRRYFTGAPVDFSAALDLDGTPFQKRVWEELRKIPYGEHRCYSQVAEALGRPAAVRAVAQAIGRNPCLVLIPCHRVLGKDGSLTGFSAGLELKKQLLRLENIPWSR